MDIFKAAAQVVDVRFDELSIGDEATLTKEITSKDIEDFARISTDVNPVHLLDDFANKSIFQERIAHGMLICSYISAVLGSKLPGKNTIYLSQETSFKAPVKIGDIITVKVIVLSKREDKKIVTLSTNVYNQQNLLVVEGKAVIKKLT
ncbi:MaoC family dehydratase [Bacillus sp. RG28]|uniref:MaoC family dehydratase n=1 Tax=Gottfriedia endophytica TaxID=2820819 RepID=A0A940NPQ4_9BACI|nr:MaoC family dehydratase [Gottfriedia endophytica]MBP0724672.1 MaoC family dehydratase [Gottfriedia endophytica]